MVCHSLLQWITFCQTSPPWPACLGWPHRHGLVSFRQGCGPTVIRLTSFLWVWFQCVCPLMPSCNTYHLTWGLLPWTWGISSPLLQQSATTASYLGRGVSPHRCPSWPWMWNSSSRPSGAHAATRLGCGVAPPGFCPWPRTWGSSSLPRSVHHCSRPRSVCHVVWH